LAAKPGMRLISTWFLLLFSNFLTLYVCFRAKVIAAALDEPPEVVVKIRRRWKQSQTMASRASPACFLCLSTSTCLQEIQDVSSPLLSENLALVACSKYPPHFSAGIRITAFARAVETDSSINHSEGLNAFAKTDLRHNPQH
jgi:hypothetical protein